MKILLVEDDSLFAQAITEYLADNGIETVLAKSTQDAINHDLSEYDAAIVDVMLPNDPIASGILVEETRGGYLSGVALTRRFRSKRSTFPIVLLSSEISGGAAREWARLQGHPFVSKNEHISRLISAVSDLGLVPQISRPRTFIVHGHDELMLAEVKDYLQNTLKWPPPIVLRDQPNQGKTIIEKFEEHAGLIDWVFVLLSPDDQSFDPKTNEKRRRARQNVIFELGFFYGFIGRLEGRVVVLKKGDVDIPSDIQGIIWIDVSAGVRASGEQIRKEVLVSI